ncbi:MAG: hypothetical protein M1510_08975 [Nitrospirae bacterium]|nr:hypothetical protein [Nitrospirota bacterium]MCL5238169.1 hypothetical protein [Nitrospirota bacterium]
MRVIDIHTHGIAGYDTRTTDAVHILRIAEIHGSQGVSEIIPTIYPAAIKVMRENMAVVREAMERQKDSNKLQVTSNELKNKKESENSLLVTRHSSLIAGVHLEGPFLNFSKCGALNSMTFLEPTEYHLKELIEGFEDMVKIITIAPELNGAPGLIRKITDRGIIASMGHSDATHAEAEAGFHAGAKGITHIFNAMRGFHHREPGIAGFGLMNKDIYIEVIADPHHLHPKTLELIFETKKAERIIIISDTVKETTPFTKGQGVTDIHGSLLGGSMTVSEASVMLIEAGFDRDVVMKCITENPERYMEAVTSDK